MTSTTRRRRAVLAAALAASIAFGSGGPGAHGAISPVAASARETRGPGAVAAALAGWEWPVSPVRIVAPFVAPAHAYGPGHRGIDLAAPVGGEVRAPAGGVVAFSGSVAGRGIVTIDHGAGLVTTLEPVTPEVAIGVAVAPGDVVARVSTGGHAAPDTLHFGVREHGEYLNPLLLLGDVPRAVLLPCC